MVLWVTPDKLFYLVLTYKHLYVLHEDHSAVTLTSCGDAHTTGSGSYTTMHAACVETARRPKSTSHPSLQERSTVLHRRKQMRVHLPLPHRPQHRRAFAATTPPECQLGAAPQDSSAKHVCAGLWLHGYLVCAHALSILYTDMFKLRGTLKSSPKLENG